jgi:hypothetical protein
LDADFRLRGKLGGNFVVPQDDALDANYHDGENEPDIPKVTRDIMRPLHESCGKLNRRAKSEAGVAVAANHPSLQQTLSARVRAYDIEYDDGDGKRSMQKSMIKATPRSVDLL